MTAPDTVFGYFVEANPIPDESALAAAVPPPPPPPVTLFELPARHPTVPITRPPANRRGMVAAAAAFAIVILLGAVWMLGPFRSQSPEPANPDELLSQEAIAAVEAIFTARNDGDIERVVALSTPVAAERATADRRVHEFQAEYAAAGMPMNLGRCETTLVSATLVTGECRVEITDPVAAEVGAADQIAPFRYENGLITILEFQGDSLLAVNRAYSDYLRTFHPDEYDASCRPGAYQPGSIVQSELLALTGECAGVAAPRAAGVAAWIRSGRPRD